MKPIPVWWNRNPLFFLWEGLSVLKTALGFIVESNCSPLKLIYQTDWMFSRPLLLHYPTPDLVLQQQTPGAKPQLTQQVFMASGKLPRSPGLGLCPRDRAQGGCLLLAMAILFSFLWWLQKCLHSRNVLMFGLSGSCPAPLGSVFDPQIRCLCTQVPLGGEKNLCSHWAPHFRGNLWWGPVHRVGEGGADVKTACDKGTQKEEIDLNGLSANIYIVVSYT